MKMMDGVPPASQIFSVKKIVRILLRLQTFNLGLEKVQDNIDNAKTEEEAYEACFTKDTIGRFGIIPNPANFVPAPSAVDNWEKDSAFARQFFCGTNPVMIEVAKDPEKQLSKNLVNYFGKGKVQELADKNQLLFVSYDDLADLKVNPHQMFPLPQNNASGPDDGPRPKSILSISTPQSFCLLMIMITTSWMCWGSNLSALMMLVFIQRIPVVRMSGLQ